MRFILFNITVGLALIYLFKGGEMPMPDWQSGLAEAKAQIGEITNTVPAASKTIDVAAGKSHGRDVIRQPKPAPKPQPKPKSKKAEPAPKLPPLDKPIQVAARPEPKQAPNKATYNIPPVPPVPPALPAVEARRAEVMAEGNPSQSVPHPTRQVALKAGTSLMSSAERRRELNALVEEMEMLYIDKVGG
jgi:hypothetical protein